MFSDLFVDDCVRDGCDWPRVRAGRGQEASQLGLQLPHVNLLPVAHQAAGRPGLPVECPALPLFVPMFIKNELPQSQMLFLMPMRLFQFFGSDNRRKDAVHIS